MTNKQENSSFNAYLIRLGERPLSSVVGDISEEVLDFELSELEEKLGLTSEAKEPDDENH